MQQGKGGRDVGVCVFVQLYKFGVKGWWVVVVVGGDCAPPFLWCCYWEQNKKNK